MRSTNVWARVSAAFFLHMHMRCCTKNWLHADGVQFTLAFTPAALYSGSAACALCMEQSRHFGAAQIMQWHKFDHVKFELTHNYQYRHQYQPISSG